MSEPRSVSFDLAGLPACHRCGAPAIVEQDAYGFVHVTWSHEHDCKVLSSRKHRTHLNSLLAAASRVTP